MQLNYPCCSKKSAKSALILGHIDSGMGEKTLAFKYRRAIEKQGFEIADLIDIIGLMGDRYEPFAQINYDLAEAGYPMMDDLTADFKLEVSDLLLILSWNFSVAALYGTGIFKTRPTVVKLFAHHAQERVLTELYRPATMIITESLLASERAMAYGIASSKILSIPHSYPLECEKISLNRDYVRRLAEMQGKTLRPSTRIIGCVGRFEYGKNCEFAIEAVRRLFEAGEEVLLVLKGDFPLVTSFPDYPPLFSKMLEAYQNAPWFIWDSASSPYPDVMSEYQSFDLLLHPSGAECGSHVVIECLGLGKPVILLDCSIHPYLFKGLANFVRTTGELREGPLPFYTPDLDDLCHCLKEFLAGNALMPEMDVVAKRFHETRVEERIPLLFNPDPSLIQELYTYDRACFDL